VASKVQSTADRCCGASSWSGRIDFDPDTAACVVGRRASERRDVDDGQRVDRAAIGTLATSGSEATTRLWPVGRVELVPADIGGFLRWLAGVTNIGPVVRDISVDKRAEQFVAIVGRSGSGK
jgi:ABC-type multidrug transport system fused ATPase/permease subunit